MRGLLRVVPLWHDLVMNPAPAAAETHTPATAPAILPCRQPDTRAVPLRRLPGRRLVGADTATVPAATLAKSAFTSAI